MSYKRMIPAALAGAGLALLASSSSAFAQTADSILANKREQARLTCISGFVWREAVGSDFTCVPPAGRDRVRAENQTAAQRKAGSGAYGADTCKAGFVWREAVGGDKVCVTPASRDTVRAENAQAAARRVGH